jgi:hypothetical protein
VILGSVELRHILFLDPSPATEFIEVDDRLLFHYRAMYLRAIHHRATKLCITSTPSQNSRVVVKAHPALTHLKDDDKPRLSRCGLLETCYFDSTHAVLEDAMQAMPLSTLLFQSSPPRVKVIYRGHCFVLEPKGGLTFGAVVGELRNLRSQCQKVLDKLVKLPCTPVNRGRLAQVIRILNGPTWFRDSIFESKSCVFLEAEGAISDEFKYVGMAEVDGVLW